MLPGLGFNSAHEGMFASEMAKEQLQADAQQRKFERRVSLGGEAEVSLFALSPPNMSKVRSHATAPDLLTCDPRMSHKPPATAAVLRLTRLRSELLH